MLCRHGQRLGPKGHPVLQVVDGVGREGQFVVRGRRAATELAVGLHDACAGGGLMQLRVVLCKGLAVR